MWVLRWIFWVIILLFLIFLGAENAAQKVTVKFMTYESPELQLWFVMYISFGVGMLVWLFGSIFKVFQMQTEIRKLNKDKVTLQRELDNLRNISIEEETLDVNDLEGEI
jgi:uncharacterized integral membrane protein